MRLEGAREPRPGRAGHGGSERAPGRGRAPAGRHRILAGPTSDAELAADPDLASALDEQQYHWAGTRDLLAAAGFLALDQPGLVFRVQEPERAWVFRAESDSGEIGYLFVRPGGESTALYRRRFPDEIVAAAREILGTPGDTGRALRPR